ncbi:sulfite exporter TauE/SafE family protein [Streptomyces sp. SS8]
MTLTLVLILALLVGVSLGLLGGGGSILTVPLLVYVAGMDAKEAIATSLFVVGVTSAVGMINHARGGRVRWRTGVLFGAAGMVGAYAGGLIGGNIPDVVLLIAFAVMMIVTAAAMLRGRRGVDPGKAHKQLPVGRVLLDGAAVGLATGLVGAGGGFLVVPALALLGGLPMPVAVGTSLLVIAMKSAAGFAGYLSTVQIDWAPTLAVTGSAIAGSLAGARLAGRVPADVLSRLFAWFVLAMGTFVLVQQAPADIRLPVLATVASLGAGAGVCYGFVDRCPLRRAVHGT